MWSALYVWHLVDAELKMAAISSLPTSAAVTTTITVTTVSNTEQKDASHIHVGYTWKNTFAPKHLNLWQQLQKYQQGYPWCILVYKWYLKSALSKVTKPNSLLGWLQWEGLMHVSHLCNHLVWGLQTNSFLWILPLEHSPKKRGSV